MYSFIDIFFSMQFFSVGKKYDNILILVLEEYLWDYTIYSEDSAKNKK